MWERPEDRLALLELLTRGTLKRRDSQRGAFDWLAELSWTRASGRRDEVTLVTERRADLVALLDRVWPTWGADHVEMLEAGVAPTPAGWATLEDARRSASLPALPARLNRRTAAAATAPGAKATLTATRLGTLGSREIVDDGALRIRPAEGVIARRGQRTLALDTVAAILDEVVISDRALRDGLTLEGPLRAVVTVENLGAWRDMPRPPGFMLVHVPGWNTATARRLLSLVKAPTLHFGDLDPNGIRIVRHLREHHPALRWLVPPFWREHLPDARPRDWPPDLDLSDAPDLVRDLAARGLWLEQERLVLDPRLPAAMESALCDATTVQHL